MKITVKSLLESCTAKEIFESLDATLKATTTITDGLAVQEIDTWLRNFIKTVGSKESQIMKDNGAAQLPSGGWDFRPGKEPLQEGDPNLESENADIRARVEKSQADMNALHNEEVEAPFEPITISFPDDKLLELVKIHANRNLSQFITMTRKK
jgi:hypothetical protein